jgi:hypothetical protein
MQRCFLKDEYNITLPNKRQETEVTIEYVKLLWQDRQL